MTNFKTSSPPKNLSRIPGQSPKSSPDPFSISSLFLTLSSFSLNCMGMFGVQQNQVHSLPLGSSFSQPYPNSFPPNTKKRASTYSNAIPQKILARQTITAAPTSPKKSFQDSTNKALDLIAQFNQELSSLYSTKESIQDSAAKKILSFLQEIPRCHHDVVVPQLTNSLFTSIGIHIQNPLSPPQTLLFLYSFITRLATSQFHLNQTILANLIPILISKLDNKTPILNHHISASLTQLACHSSTSTSNFLTIYNHFTHPLKSPASSQNAVYIEALEAHAKIRIPYPLAEPKTISTLQDALTLLFGSLSLQTEEALDFIIDFIDSPTPSSCITIETILFPSLYPYLADPSTSRAATETALKIIKHLILIDLPLYPRLDQHFLSLQLLPTLLSTHQFYIKNLPTTDPNLTPFYECIYKILLLAADTQTAHYQKAHKLLLTVSLDKDYPDSLRIATRRFHTNILKLK